MAGVLKLKFKFKNAGEAEDLYACEGSNTVYARQKTNIDGVVCWLSTVKWQGGYEASCNLDPGWVMEVEYKGKLYRELCDGRSSRKQFPFSWEE